MKKTIIVLALFMVSTVSASQIEKLVTGNSRISLRCMSDKTVEYSNIEYLSFTDSSLSSGLIDRPIIKNTKDQILKVTGKMIALNNTNIAAFELSAQQEFNSLPDYRKESCMKGHPVVLRPVQNQAIFATLNNITAAIDIDSPGKTFCKRFETSPIDRDGASIQNYVVAVIDNSTSQIIGKGLYEDDIHKSCESSVGIALLDYVKIPIGVAAWILMGMP